MARNKSNSASSVAKSGSARPRRKMVRTSEEVQRWSALLAEEMVSWPNVRSKPMFGFYAYYRGDALFTILPRTRGFDSGSLLILKFNPMPEELSQRARGDARLDTSTRVPGKGWFTFELASEEDLRDALWWIQQAFACATKPTRERVNRKRAAPRKKSRRAR
jgi:hypothetical protein